MVKSGNVTATDISLFFMIKGDTMIAFYNRDSSSIDNKEAAASSQITVKLG